LNSWSEKKVALAPLLLMIIRNTIKKIFMSQTNFSGSTFSTFEAKKEVQEKKVALAPLFSLQMY
jgi:hypothetical protein